ncbi:MAG: sporulation initiation factor Spo0A C-terminal domain-containing protein [Clostridia bacterium]
MESKPMKILIIEDDINDCNNFVNCIKSRKDIELVALTDSDIEGLKYVKLKHPEGIVLDLELNNSITGNTDSLEFLSNLRKLNLNYQPIIIVTTHVNSKRTYDILHRNGVDLILYKDHPNYSCDYVLNKFLNLRNSVPQQTLNTLKEELEESENKISDCIYHELDLIGVTPKLKGRQYIHDAILYLIQNENNNTNVIRYLTKAYKKSGNTITNGIQNAIIHAWRVSSIEDLTTYYTARVNYETGIPTPMEFIYYYADKIKKKI